MCLTEDCWRTKSSQEKLALQKFNFPQFPFGSVNICLQCNVRISVGNHFVYQGDDRRGTSIRQTWPDTWLHHVKSPSISASNRTFIITDYINYHTWTFHFFQLFTWILRNGVHTTSIWCHTLVITLPVVVFLWLRIVCGYVQFSGIYQTSMVDYQTFEVKIEPFVNPTHLCSFVNSVTVICHS